MITLGGGNCRYNLLTWEGARELAKEVNPVTGHSKMEQIVSFVRSEVSSLNFKHSEVIWPVYGRYFGVLCLMLEAPHG